MDEVYEYRNLGTPPRIDVWVTRNPDQSVTFTYNVDFRRIASLAGVPLAFGPHTPLQAAMKYNQLLWSAANEKCDLYLSSPISTMVGDKLYEAHLKAHRAQHFIEQLKGDVEFPDIRSLVDQNKIRFNEILTIRKKARRFRGWLHDESERDRNAILAYHNEVAKESGLVAFGRKTLDLVGVFGGSAVGGALGNALAGPAGGALGSATGAGVTYLLNLGARLGADWKLVVFGKWLKERIEGLLASR